MFYVTYDGDGLLQHLRTYESVDQSYITITAEQAEVLRQEGEFHRWRLDLSEQKLYRLPDCDPKYHATVNGRVVEMSEEEKAEVDARQVHPVDAEAMRVRQDRNARLAACDWTVLPDAPIAYEAIVEWRVYRQALRDITDQQGFPNEVNWPDPPQGI